MTRIPRARRERCITHVGCQILGCPERYVNSVVNNISCGLYYKHLTIINDASRVGCSITLESIIDNKAKIKATTHFSTSVTYDNRHMTYVYSTGHRSVCSLQFIGWEKATTELD